MKGNVKGKKYLHYFIMILLLSSCALLASISAGLLTKRTYTDAFSKDTMRTINGHLYEYLRYAENTMDQALTLGVYSLYYQSYEVSPSQSYASFSASSDISFSNYSIYTALRSMKSAGDIVDSVYFYDGSKQFIWDSNATMCPLDKHYDTGIGTLFKANLDSSENPSDRLAYYTRSISDRSFRGNTVYFQTAVYSKKDDKHIAVNLDLNRLLAAARQSLASSVSASVILMTSDGKIVLSELPGGYVPNADVLTQSAQASVRFEGPDKIQYRIIKTESDDLGLQLYGVIRQSILNDMAGKSIASLYSLQFLMFFIYTILFALFAVLFIRPILKTIRAILTQSSGPSQKGAERPSELPETCANASLFSINRMLGALYDKSSRLNREIQLFQPVYIANLLTNLLTDKLENAGQILFELQEYGIELPSEYPYYTAVLEIKLNETESEENRNESRSIYKQYIVTRCNDLLDHYTYGFAAELEGSLIGLAYSSKYGKEGLSGFLLNIRTYLLTKLGMRASIAIGSQASNSAELYDSFQEAVNALNYRITFSPDEIIDAELIHIRCGMLTNYYNAMREPLLAGIAAGDAEKTCDYIDSLFAYIEKERHSISFREAADMAIALIHSIWDLLDNKTVNCSTIFEKTPYDRYRQITHMTRTDLSEMLRGIATRASCCFEVRDDRSYNRAEKLIRKACRFIDENYMQDLPLERVAEYVDLNPSYFSRLFKETTGGSFIKYLEQIRIREAARLIKNGGILLSEISLKVGYNSPNYFSKVFKRQTGVTPEEYRRSSWM